MVHIKIVLDKIIKDIEKNIDKKLRFNDGKKIVEGYMQKLIKTMEK